MAQQPQTNPAFDEFQKKLFDKFTTWLDSEQGAGIRSFLKSLPMGLGDLILGLFTGGGAAAQSQGPDGDGNDKTVASEENAIADLNVLATALKRDPSAATEGSEVYTALKHIEEAKTSLSEGKMNLRADFAVSAEQKAGLAPSLSALAQAVNTAFAGGQNERTMERVLKYAEHAGETPLETPTEQVQQPSPNPAPGK